MISIEIDDIKGFMNKLLKQDVFDRFLVHSLELQMAYRVDIDGALIKNSNEIDLNEQEMDNPDSYITWAVIREDIFSMLKHNKTPRVLKISFLMSHKATSNIINKISNATEEKNVTGFILNIIYEGNSLKIVTATNYKSFTLDKSFEQYFDESMIKFLNKNEIK